MSSVTLNSLRIPSLKDPAPIHRHFEPPSWDLFQSLYTFCCSCCIKNSRVMPITDPVATTGATKEEVINQELEVAPVESKAFCQVTSMTAITQANKVTKAVTSAPFGPFPAYDPSYKNNHPVLTSIVVMSQTIHYNIKPDHVLEVMRGLPKALATGQFDSKDPIQVNNWVHHQMTEKHISMFYYQEVYKAVTDYVKSYNERCDHYREAWKPKKRTP